MGFKADAAWWPIHLSFRDHHQSIQQAIKGVASPRANYWAYRFWIIQAGMMPGTACRSHERLRLWFQRHCRRLAFGLLFAFLHYFFLGRSFELFAKVSTLIIIISPFITEVPKENSLGKSGEYYFHPLFRDRTKRDVVKKIELKIFISGFAYFKW